MEMQMQRMNLFDHGFLKRYESIEEILLAFAVFLKVPLVTRYPGQVRCQFTYPPYPCRGLPGLPLPSSEPITLDLPGISPYMDWQLGDFDFIVLPTGFPADYVGIRRHFNTSLVACYNSYS